MIEPIQGEGGFVVCPQAFLEGVRRICDEHGIVLIVDEVQTGFGRTGRMFAIEHNGVEPDLMVVAKSIAAGLPLSGVLGRAEIMDAPGDSAIGGTYVGNPVAQAAAARRARRLRGGGSPRPREPDRRDDAGANARVAGPLRRDRGRARRRRDARDRARPGAGDARAGAGARDVRLRARDGRGPDPAARRASTATASACSCRS